MLKKLIATLVFVIVGGVLAAPSLAAFPGANGMISFDRRVPGRAGFWGLHTVNPDASGLNWLNDKAAPVWSPDGNKLLYSGYPAFGFADLYVMNADGTNVKKLTEGISAWSASWSPDGTQIAYMKSAADNKADAEVWVMNADGTGKKQITNDYCAKFGLDWGRPAGVSKIAFVDSCPDGWGVYLINPDGSGKTRVTTVSGDVAFGSGGNIDWSPDGTKMVLSGGHWGLCAAGDCQWDIYVADLFADTLVNMTNTRGRLDPYEHGAVWSPDGTRLAFAAYSLVEYETGPWWGPQAIYTMSASGGGVVKVTDPQLVDLDEYAGQAKDGSPDWQPCIAGVTRTCVSVAPPSHPDPDPDPDPDPRTDPKRTEPKPSPRSTPQPAQKKLLVDSFVASPRSPKAGRLFTVRLRAVTTDGQQVEQGTVSCALRAGKKGLRAVARGVRRGSAFCAWRIPRKSRGSKLRGSIALRSTYGTVGKGFIRRVG